ncbi:unnamed protein product, partial [Urochloa humidicola]
MGKPPQKSWAEAVWEELPAVVAELPAPGIKRGNISEDEELIIRLHKLLGNRWSL